MYPDVAALLAVSLYSSGRVQGFAQDISADLDCALEAVRQKDFPTARQALAEGAELCDTMRETMSHLLHGRLHGAGSCTAGGRRIP